MTLNIERTDKEIVIKLPINLKIDDVQRMLDYLSYKQAIDNSLASQKDADELAISVKKGWWEANKDRWPDLTKK